MAVLDLNYEGLAVLGLPGMDIIQTV